jgi:Fe-S cluster assembly protein SufB
MTASNQHINELIKSDYSAGWVTDIESDTAPPGLNEDVVRLISRKKGEPEWLLDWRLRAFRHWLKLEQSGPTWAKVKHAPIDYQAISYYSAPRQKVGPKSLDEVDPELLRTYEKLGIPLHERASTPYSTA